MVVATLTTQVPGDKPIKETVEIVDKIGKTFWIVRPLGSNARFPVRAWRVTKVKTQQF